jgi:hypothetical protein
VQRYQWLMEPVHSLSSHRYCHIAGFHRQRLHDIVVGFHAASGPESLLSLAVSVWLLCSTSVCCLPNTIGTYFITFPGASHRTFVFSWKPDAIYRPHLTPHIEVPSY